MTSAETDYELCCVTGTDAVRSVLEEVAMVLWPVHRPEDVARDSSIVFALSYIIHQPSRIAYHSTPHLDVSLQRFGLSAQTILPTPRHT